MANTSHIEKWVPLTNELQGKIGPHLRGTGILKMGPSFSAIGKVITWSQSQFMGFSQVHPLTNGSHLTRNVQILIGSH